MGSQTSPYPHRMVFPEGLARTRVVKWNAWHLLRALEDAGFEPDGPLLTALWRLFVACEGTEQFIWAVLGDRQFNEIGIFVTRRGEWWNLGDIQASCPRVFPTFVLENGSYPSLA